MGEIAHTPGPWAFQGVINVAYAGYFSIGFPDESGFVVAYGIGEANARLIAAAPELLDALKGLLAMTDFDQSEPWIVSAHAAIAKATGSSRP